MEYALRALSRRAHTIHEMSTKLRKREGHTPELETAVLTRLMELKYLDDESYIQRAIETATQFRHEGRYKLAQRLYKKGIPLKKTYQHWDQAQPNERAIAEKALKKVLQRCQGLPSEKRYQRISRFLASRGFSPDIVLDLAKNHAQE